MLDFGQEKFEALLIPLSIIWSEPQPAMLFGLHVKEFDLSFHVWAFFPGVIDLNEVNLTRPGGGMLNRFFRLVDIASIKQAEVIVKQYEMISA
jgi:hypothetical protein